LPSATSNPAAAVLVWEKECFSASLPSAPAFTSDVEFGRSLAFVGWSGPVEASSSARLELSAEMASLPIEISENKIAQDGAGERRRDSDVSKDSKF